MVIPKKIRIVGQDISVVNKERLDNDILGEICLAERFKECFKDLVKEAYPLV